MSAEGTASGSSKPALPLPDLARLPVFAAMGTVAALLTMFSAGYGYHRDELYFRMLEPAWGYVDQPPLTPLLARAMRVLVADEAWALRLPATLASTASVLAVVLLTRELGGGRAAQTWCAWAYAFAATPLLFGHVLLTSSLDLVVWPLVTWCVLRALLRDHQEHWWLVAGVVAGLSTYNKLLVVWLAAALAIGLAVSGPRRVLTSRWLWAGAAAALVLAAPNVAYQATHDWPQLTMGAALADNNSADVRVDMWLLLVLLLGPPLVVFWAAGLVSLVRRPQWRPARLLVPAFAALLVFTFVAGAQPHYPVGLLVVLFAAGCVPVSEFVVRSPAWRWPIGAAVAANAVVSAVIALPLVPVSMLGDTPVPEVNQLAQDQVGWPTYVRQVASVYRTLSAAAAGDAVVVASNYGEAGAVDRYGPELDLPAVYSAQNELYFQARPPESTRVVVFVGGQLDEAARYFASCEVITRLDDGVGVDNEEQGQPVAVCRAPLTSWKTLWAELLHYD